MKHEEFVKLIETLSGLEEVDMPHTAEVAPDEAYAMVQKGRWSLEEFEGWVSAQGSEEELEIDDEDDWVANKNADERYGPAE